MTGSVRRRTGLMAGQYNNSDASRRGTGAVRRETVRRGMRRETVQQAMRRETGVRRRTGMRRTTGMQRRTVLGRRRQTASKRRQTASRRRQTASRRRQTARRLTAARRKTGVRNGGSFSVIRNDRLPGMRPKNVESLGAQFWGTEGLASLSKKDESIDASKDDEDKKDSDEKQEEERTTPSPDKTDIDEEGSSEAKKTSTSSSERDGPQIVNLNSPKVPFERYGGLLNVLAALITIVRREMLTNPVGMGRPFENPTGTPSSSQVPEAVWKEDKAYFLKLRESRERVDAVSNSPLRTFAPVDDFSYLFDRRIKYKTKSTQNKHLPWVSVTARSSLVRDMLQKRTSKPKRRTVREGWAKMQAQTWKSRRECAEHLVHTLESEQVKEMKRAAQIARSSKHEDHTSILVNIAKERADAADKIMRMLHNYKLVKSTEMAKYLKHTLSGYKDKQLTEALSTQTEKKISKSSTLVAAQHCYLRKLKLPPTPTLRPEKGRKKKKKKAAKKKDAMPPGILDGKKVTDAGDEKIPAETGKKSGKNRTKIMKSSKKKARAITFNKGGENTAFVDDVLKRLSKRGIIEETGKGFNWKLPVAPLKHIPTGQLRGGRHYSDIFGRHFYDLTGRRELNGQVWRHPLERNHKRALLWNKKDSTGD